MHEYLENIIIFTDRYYLSRIRILFENLYTLSVKNNCSLDKLCLFFDNHTKSEHSILLGIYYKINTTHIADIKYDNKNRNIKLGMLISEQGYKIGDGARQIIAILIRWLNEKLGTQNMLLGVKKRNTHALRIYQKLVLGMSK